MNPDILIATEVKEGPLPKFKTARTDANGRATVMSPVLEGNPQGFTAVFEFQGNNEYVTASRESVLAR